MPLKENGDGERIVRNFKKDRNYSEGTEPNVFYKTESSIARQGLNINKNIKTEQIVQRTLTKRNCVYPLTGKKFVLCSFMNIQALTGY